MPTSGMSNTLPKTSRRRKSANPTVSRFNGKYSRSGHLRMAFTCSQLPTATNPMKFVQLEIPPRRHLRPLPLLRNETDRANIVAVEEVPNERVDRYGVVGISERIGKMVAITAMVEKPPRDRAPSNLNLTGRYILQPDILDLLGRQERGTGGKIQLTDVMIQLARTQAFYGLEFEGRSFDCGSKIGFLAANVSYALSRTDIAPSFRAEIKKIFDEIKRG